ncbi:hypothetical protein P691DRAFT_504353 [Macrolepiota fuliginosa MF-IS2]|uniref:Uncharacterized protein n=1 Tax=Macrolepiota fuliginosa MF-IS2 TaxID=1400762 RepID=A0A9P5X0T4_9AGAR|nr:hypothetical protein P691DRAFT_504353 [Macrolepiota fuliginosa MF-IS2]
MRLSGVFGLSCPPSPSSLTESNKYGTESDLNRLPYSYSISREGAAVVNVAVDPNFSRSPSTYIEAGATTPFALANVFLNVLWILLFACSSLFAWSFANVLFFSSASSLESRWNSTPSARLMTVSYIPSSPSIKITGTLDSLGKPPCSRACSRKTCFAGDPRGLRCPGWVGR